MRVSCPACDAAYEVPDTMLGGSRRVRCARCAEEWTVTDAPAEPPRAGAGPLETLASGDPGNLASLAPPATTPPSADRAGRITARAPERLDVAAGTATRRRKGSGSAVGVLVAWVLTFAVLGGVAAGAYLWRDAVMQAWPPSRRAYAAMGLA